MVLKMNEINILKLKAGDKLWVTTSVESDDKRKKQVKATVIRLYARYFLARIDCKTGSYNRAINYVTCHKNSSRLIYKRRWLNEEIH